MASKAAAEVKQRINEKVKVAGDVIRRKNIRGKQNADMKITDRENRGDTNKNSTPECAVNNKRYVT
ncbi:hypothetical protein [Morganella morganii]|uniref:hypothetical protein n=1 Tax=Morganella morganii TaxID=582 RepID=UPI0012998C7D|nr:hypothetical protein [Morganella morganii]MBT0381652.1 hypothetical protein [Morganella morganii subsp. morganii]MRE57886.1 hypothetical protein [Morganella morganii]HBL6964740.1 hypothetical protein [Morganella morganii]HDU8609115.1 hypothetical protein [Morganella morganii]HDU8647451.1 hypothetical protein [Morganella morganii subsp. morganii]